MARIRTPKNARQLSYDAAKTTHRRRAPSSRVVAEHVILPDSERKKLLGTVQDQVRNASIAAWMIRRHLDYVSKFRVQVRTGNEKLDTLLKRLFDWHARPLNFDIAGRFGREEMFRMFELEKVTAGDAALIKLKSGHLQAIESDLIALPAEGRWRADQNRADPLPSEIAATVEKNTGVVMDPGRPGRIKQFCICSRQPNGTRLSFDHLEDAENVIFDGYFTRFASQVRGVSPLSTAINSIQDVYEGIDFNLAKSKVHALFGIAIMRDYVAGESAGEEAAMLGAAAGLADPGESADTDAGEKISASLQEMSPNQMMMIDMDTKGRIDTIESRTPSSEFREFTEYVTRLSLIALDIPYTALDSRATTFSGMIADQNLYEVSCRGKREKNLWKRKEYSDWLLAREWKDESSRWRIREVAEAAGYTELRHLQEAVEWVAAGFPWLQKMQEVDGDIKAISIGLDNPVDAARRRGGDVFKNLDKTAEVYDYAKKLGVPLMVGLPGQSSVAEEESQRSE